MKKAKTKFTKLMAVTLVFAMLLSMIPVQGVQAQTELVKISSVSDWNNFVKNVNNGNSYRGKLVILTNDIDFKGEEVYTINGYGFEVKTDNTLYGNGFEGDFDGRGHTMKNIIIPEGHRGGLFGNLSNQDFRNLYLENFTINDQGWTKTDEGYDYFLSTDSGSLFYRLYNCTVNNVHILSGTIDVDGGIALIIDNTKLINCSNNANVYGAIAGGLVANACNHSIIRNCANTGKIEGSGYYLFYHNSSWCKYFTGAAAGICTSLDNDVRILNCYNAGKVDTHDAVGGGYNIFGICCGGDVRNCYYLEGASEDEDGDTIGVEGAEISENNKMLSRNVMTSEAFVEELNSHRAKGDRKWLYNPGGFPVVNRKYIPKRSQKITGVSSKYYVQVGKKTPDGKNIALLADSMTPLHFAMVENAKGVSVDTRGVVHVKQNCINGKYKVKIWTDGDSIFKKASKTVTIKVNNTWKTDVKNYFNSKLKRYFKDKIKYNKNSKLKGKYLQTEMATYLAGQKNAIHKLSQDTIKYQCGKNPRTWGYKVNRKFVNSVTQKGKSLFGSGFTMKYSKSRTQSFYRTFHNKEYIVSNLKEDTSYVDFTVKSIKKKNGYYIIKCIGKKHVSYETVGKANITVKLKDTAKSYVIKSINYEYQKL